MNNIRNFVITAHVDVVPKTRDPLTFPTPACRQAGLSCQRGRLYIL